MPQLPDPVEEQVMGIAGEWKVYKVLERLHTSRGLKLTGRRIATEDLNNFQVKKVGGVERLSR